MNSAALLADAFGRIREIVHRTVTGLTPEELAVRLDEEANSIGWLVWHLTRVQDDHVAGVAGTEQIWTSGGWADRFGLPFDRSETGYGFSPDQVAQVQIESPQLLLDYGAAVHEKTAGFLRGLSDDDLDRVVDTRWDPPVTLGVRLVSVLSDDLQHIGQAAYVRGLLTS